LKIRKEVIVMMVKQMQLEIIAEENDKYSIRISVDIRYLNQLMSMHLLLRMSSTIMRELMAKAIQRA
jgi:hypothetical protein